ncbi:MAG TPA: PilN domain-containing protein [Chthonomonadaceae bacterium]|nr:PilN domain-containing protein [Chthonomonadaceae bacterium]
MTVADGFPCIDLYARPRKQRRAHDLANRREVAWIGGALIVVLVLEAIVLRELTHAGAQLQSHLGQIERLQKTRKGFEQARAALAQQAEKRRGLEGTIATRAGWIRLLQAIASTVDDRDVLEQCLIEGKAHRSVQLTGSAQDLTELQAMLRRLKALPCLTSVRLLETASDNALGDNSIHFRIEARCDASELARETQQ